MHFITRRPIHVDRIATDEERLAKGTVVCDALCAYCRQTREAASEL